MKLYLWITHFVQFIFSSWVPTHSESLYLLCCFNIWKAKSPARHLPLGFSFSLRRSHHLFLQMNCRTALSESDQTLCARLTHSFRKNWPLGNIQTPCAGTFVCLLLSLGEAFWFSSRRCYCFLQLLPRCCYSAFLSFLLLVLFFFFSSLSFCSSCAHVNTCLFVATIHVWLLISWLIM